MSERKYQPGYYRARGVAGTEQHGFAKEGGDQISLELDVQISDQEFARLTTIFSFSGKAGPISIERLKALGWDGSNELRGIDQNEVEVEIKYEAKRDNPNEERMVVEVKTAGGRFAFKKPKSPQEIRGFMSALSQQAAQLANGTAPQGAPPRQGPPANVPPTQQNYKL